MDTSIFLINISLCKWDHHYTRMQKPKALQYNFSFYSVMIIVNTLLSIQHQTFLPDRGGITSQLSSTLTNLASGLQHHKLCFYYRNCSHQPPAFTLQPPPKKKKKKNPISLFPYNTKPSSCDLQGRSMTYMVDFDQPGCNTMDFGTIQIIVLLYSFYFPQPSSPHPFQKKKKKKKKGLIGHFFPYLPSCSHLQGSSMAYIVDFDQPGHKTMDFAAVKVLLWILVVKLKVGEPILERKPLQYYTWPHKFYQIKLQITL